MNANRRLRLDANLRIDDVVAQLRTRYPRISKAAVSMAENSDATGITYSQSAARDFRAVVGCTRDNRRCPIRIQCRLTEADRDEFNRARVIMGHDTVDEAVKCALHWYIRTANKIAAANSATVRDGTGKCPVTSITSKEAVVNVQA